MHLATKGLSFVVAHRVDVPQRTNLALKGAHSTLKVNQDGKHLAKKHEQIFKMTKLLVEKAQKRYKKQVNAGRRKVEYDVGQDVLLNVNTFTIPKGLTPRFISKFGVPVPIVE